MPKTKSAKKKVSKKTSKKVTPKTKKSKPVKAFSGSKKRTDKMVYPKPVVVIYSGEEAYTAEKAKELLGWEEEPDKNKFSSDYLLKDANGSKVRCSNNGHNRPFFKSNCNLLKQEILCGRFQLNLENIIVGKTGLILNGQHRLVALVLATQEQNNDPDKWGDTEPTIETSIAFGGDESDEVVNTMDTAKPRSLSDVIYRSHFFSDSKKTEQAKLARITEYAIRMLWSRTGAGLDAFSPLRTHSESLDFLNRHPKILECVRHIFVENNKDSLSNLVSLGYAAGLLYLMGSCNSEGEKYASAETRNEKSLEWDSWDDACNFWVCLAGRAKEVDALHIALRGILEDGSISERIALIVKGWLCYANSGKITAKKIELEYKIENDIKILIECPTVGGIDLGNPQDASVGDPTPQQLDKSKTKERKRRKENGKAKNANPIIVGDHVWVVNDDDDDDDTWDGVVEEIYENGNDRIVKVAFQNGSSYDVPFSTVQHDEPVRSVRWSDRQNWKD